MLIRIGGGRGGIKEYLENGHKAGREFSRDDLDQRLTLLGNLDVTGHIIDQFDNAGEKYMHITMSFYEDAISEKMLRDIAAEFKEFALGAYDPAEYDLYAEAHLPKIKSYVDNKTGEVIQRKGHIHFVIPRQNQVTGKKLSPLGFEEHNIKFINAFQEHINNKYGLVSPKDRPRHALTDGSDLIARYKADTFNVSMRETRESIFNAVIDRKIETVEAFKTLLAEYGTVKKSAQYFTVQPEGKGKAIRLKDNVFSEGFITLPTEQKLAMLKAEVLKEYTEAGTPRPTPAQIAATLAEWKSLRSLEVIHLNSGNRKEYAAYKKLSRDEKISFLAEKEANHRNTYYPEQPNEQRNLIDTLRAAGHDLQSASHHLEAVGGHSHNLDAAAGYVADRTNSRAIAAAISRCLADQEAPSGPVATPAERLQEAGERHIAEPELALESLTRTQSVFTFQDLERYLQRHTGSAEQTLAALDAVLNSPELVRQIIDGKERFTTREILKIETDLIASGDKLAASNGKALSEASRSAAASTRQFNAGQAAAFDLLTSEKRIAVVNGAAGTGKSYVLAAMREAYEKEGFTLYGAILQGKTAEDLERDSGIKSRTMHSFLSALDKGQVKLDKKSVVVVDEAGMIGSRQMQKLLAHVEKAGASVRLVGDVKQLAAVDFGSAFSALSSRVELVSLTDIRRQSEAWQRAASTALSNHNIKDGINAYAERDLVKQAATRNDAKAALVQQWAEDRAAEPTKTQIVIAHSNQEREALNRLMRAALKEQGALGPETALRTVNGLLKFAPNDQIMFLKNDYDALKVKNGTTATIQSIEGKIIEAKLADGRIVKIDTETYGHIDHGYALTIYKTQGMTVDRAYLLASENMTADNAYVGMTRHKDSLQVHYSAEQFKDKAALIKSMSRTNTKEFSAPAASPTTPAKEADSVVDHLLRDAKADRLAKLEGAKPEFDDIKRTLSAERLLAHVAKSHGVAVDAYTITKAKDGSDRILCGTKAHNVADFLTKELHLDWNTEAKAILREVAEDQMRAVSIEPPQSLNTSLWNDFQQWKRGDYENEKQIAWQGQGDAARARLADIKVEFAQAKASIEIRIDPRQHVERRAALSVVRMQRIEKEKGASTTNKAERADLKKSHAIKNADLYRDYLTRQAQKGNEAALTELRRQQKKGVMPTPASVDALTTTKGAKVNDSAILHQAKTTYTVNARGDVTYQRDGEAVMRDEARSVVLIQTDDDTIETALRLGMSKFGKELTVNGTEDFQRRAVEIAVERGIYITFKSDTLKQYQQHLQEQTKLVHAAQREESRRPRGEILIEHGEAPYEFKKGKSESYYAKLRNDAGDEKIVWGVDIKRSLAEANAAPGDAVLLTRGDRQKLKIKEVAKDGTINEIEVERVVWKTKLTQAKEVQTTLPTPPAKPLNEVPLTTQREPMKNTTEANMADKRTAYRAEQLAIIAEREREAATARQQAEQNKKPKTPGRDFSM